MRPDYSKYSLSDLEDALAHINRAEYPERAEELQRRISIARASIVDDEDKVTIEVTDSAFFTDKLDYGGYLLTTLSVLYGPFGEDLGFLMRLASALAVPFAYYFVVQLSVGISNIEEGSWVAFILSAISWGWCLYWLQVRGLLLPAFVGHLLYLGTVGRLIIFLGWMKDSRSGGTET